MTKKPSKKPISQPMHAPEVMIDASRLVIAVIILKEKSYAFFQNLMTSFRKQGRKTLSAEEKFLLPKEGCPEENKMPMTFVRELTNGILNGLHKTTFVGKACSKKSIRDDLAELDKAIEEDKEFGEFVQGLAKKYFRRKKKAKKVAG